VPTEAGEFESGHERGDTGLTRGPERAKPARVQETAFDAALATSARPEARELSERRRHSIVRRRGALLQRALVIADLAGLSLAFAIAELRWGVNTAAWDNRLGIQAEVLVFVAMLPCWVIAANLSDLYRKDEERVSHSTADDFGRVFLLVTIGVWLFQGGSWVTQLAQPQFPKLFAFWIGAVTLVTLARSAARHLSRRLPGYVQNTVILGAGDVGQLIARKLLQHPEYGLNLVGFVDSDRTALQEHLHSLSLLATPDRLPELARALSIERVIVAEPNEPHQVTTSLIHRLRSLEVQVDIVPPFFEVIGPGIDMHTVQGIPLVGLPPTKLSARAFAVKRIIDIVLATFLLTLSAPLLVFAAIRIKLDSHGPILFRQKRLGLNMREFTMLKFRTMKVGADQEVHRQYVREIMSRTAEPDERGLYKLERRDEITRFGAWLRRTSLDELPQLINVLCGEMSIVGPRPCLPYEVENFEPHHFERFLVPPGLTGLWQVTARARSTFLEALEMDVAYVRGWSLGLDLRLLVRTPLQVFAKHGTT
jgi:exopolysaccharide biosynthesis polyprenyl glycosylphosphotransferase